MKLYKISDNRFRQTGFQNGFRDDRLTIASQFGGHQSRLSQVRFHRRYPIYQMMPM
jgi:hypothetical protein